MGDFKSEPEDKEMVIQRIRRDQRKKHKGKVRGNESAAQSIS